MKTKLHKNLWKITHSLAKELVLVPILIFMLLICILLWLLNNKSFYETINIVFEEEE